MSTPWLFMCETVAFHQQSLQKVTYSHTCAHTNTHTEAVEEEARKNKKERKGTKARATCGVILPAHMHAYNMV